MQVMKNCEGKRRAAGGEDKARASDCTQHQLIKLDMCPGSLQISLNCYKKLSYSGDNFFESFQPIMKKNSFDYSMGILTGGPRKFRFDVEVRLS